MNKLSKAKFLVGLGLIVFALYSCGPKEKKSTLVLPKTLDSSIIKVSSHTLSVKIEDGDLSKFNNLALEPLIWGNLITNIFANFESYEVTKTDTTPYRELNVLSAKLGENRNHYLIRTKEAIYPGEYKMIIHKSSTESFINKEFTVLAGDGLGIDDDNIGNYIPYNPSRKFYKDGTIISVIDAELGSPSFYVLSIAIPADHLDDATKNISYIALASNIKDVVNNKDKHRIAYGSSASTDLRVAESFTTGFSPELTKNFQDANSGITASTPRETSFFYDQYLAQDIDYSGFDFTDSGFSSKDDLISMGYNVLEVIVFLDQLPEIDHSYFAEINMGALNVPSNLDFLSGTIKTADFKFRNAYTPTILKSVLSIKSDTTICFLNDSSGRIKCVGDNSGRQTGYDAANDIESNPYQLSFVSGIENIESLALTQLGQTACAIIDYDESYKTSSVKCWGSNLNGALGIGDYYNVDAGSYQNISPTAKLVLPKDSSLVSPPIGYIGFNAKSISASSNSFCVSTFEGKLYCWGTSTILGPDESAARTNGISNTFYDAPVELTIKSNNNEIRDIKSFELGNNPERCVIGNTVDGVNTVDSGVFCLVNSENKKVYAPASNTQEIATRVGIGEGHVCYIIATKDPITGEPIYNIKNNVYCAGENSANQLGNINNTSTSISNPVNASLNDDIAIDIVAGQSFTCYININNRLKCVGNNQLRTNFTLDKTSDGNDGFSGGEYISFGKNEAGDEVIDVIGFSRSVSLMCVDLRYAPRPVSDPTNYLYATKCWGNRVLSGGLYYLPDSIYPKENHISYTPVVRW